ncbi:MAG: TetR/AcrR family transcriptional regulator [Phycisphaerales bacterium]
MGIAATPSSSGKGRLLEAAIPLFLRNGFGPVGIDQIIDTVGVTKTTFYKHFESKDDLIVKALAHHHEMEMGKIQAEIARIGGGDPRAQVLAIFDVLDAWFAEAGFRGCIFINAATEFPQKSDPIHVAAVMHGDDLSTLICEKLIAAGAARGPAEVAAERIMLLVTGAVVSRQTAVMYDAAKVARPMVEMLVDRAIAG